MKALAHTILLLVAACQASVPPAAPVSPAAGPPATSPPLPPPAVAMVSKAYQVTASRELPKVFSPQATADYVTRIHQADLEARRKLTTLERQGQHYTQAALHAARDAVGSLDAVLESEP